MIFQVSGLCDKLITGLQWTDCLIMKIQMTFPIYIEYAASSDSKSYYTHMLDRDLEQNPVPKGLVMLLHQHGALCSCTSRL